MAYNTAISNNGFDGVKSVFSSIARFFTGFGTHLAMTSSMNSRIGYLRSLQAKSDAELAQMNLKRDDVVHHVFRDLYYL